MDRETPQKAEPSTKEEYAGGLTTYRYALRPLVAEFDASGAATSRFVFGSRFNLPDFMVKGGTTCAFLLDHLGSSRLVMNAATGSTAQRLDYDEFGKVILDTNPGIQLFGFAGRLHERWLQLDSP